MGIKLKSACLHSKHLTKPYMKVILHTDLVVSARSWYPDTACTGYRRETQAGKPEGIKGRKKISNQRVCLQEQID